MSKQRRTIALDFDGVLHKYNGYQNGLVQGPIVGAKDAVETLLAAGNTVVVFTTRPPSLVEPWLKEHGFPPLEVTSVKRPFWVLVDDRAIHFGGSWEGLVKEIEAFKPWWIAARN